jgi:hypothetical protein
MARVTIVNSPIYNLNLTSKEAKYLHAITQNYMGHHPNDESADECSMRADIWECLNEALSNG